MKRTILTWLLAIALLSGGSVAVILLLTGSRTSTPPAEGPASQGEASAPATAPGTTSPMAVARPPARLPGASPGTVHPRIADPADRGLANRVVRKAVRKALLARPVQSRLAGCAGRSGGIGTAGEPGPVPRGAPAVLMLEMETLRDELRIVDAQVETWGEASQASVSCARDVLRGQVISASSVERGQRVRMLFPLSPRG